MDRRPPSSLPSQVTVVLEETIEYSLPEICSICGAETDFILELMEWGVLDPQGDEITELRFTHHHLQRSRKALHLQQDLGINMAGVAMALELLEEMDALQQRIGDLESELRLFR